MATVSFLWHLHQPAYRTADGVSHAPWAILHAGGAYTTLARALESTSASGHVVNIVPTLLEQLIAYAEEKVTDPVLDAVLTPATELSDTQIETLVAWGFHVNPRQLARYPKLGELAQRRPPAGTKNRLASRYGPGDLRDLQVLFVLAHAGEQAWTDARLAPLYERGGGFGADDHRQVAAWLRVQPAELIEGWRRLAVLPGVEISTSPFAHPIAPLLIDTGVVTASWAPHQAPEVPAFHYPRDACRQLEKGRAFMRDLGFDTAGCWPPEASVSAEAVAMYAEAGVRWLVTDEGILERSLGRPLRNGDHTADELYRPWRLDGMASTLFFRDRRLSDAIGFEYGRWGNEAEAAESLVRRLEELAKSLANDASIVIALDGENPWLHYPEGGGRFLRELASRLNDGPPHLVPATLSGVSDLSKPDILERLHPGSWINSTFATWIGHPEKTRAWEVLSALRSAIGPDTDDPPPSLLLAEGSDWFWWLGDDNPTGLAPLYDKIFRLHLIDACVAAGIESPVDLEQPLKTLTRSLQVPVSKRRPAPVIDGRITSYFEWSMAVWVEAETEGPLRRLAVWGGNGRLHIMVECSAALQPLVDRHHLQVSLRSMDGRTLKVDIGGRRELPPGVDFAIGRVAELSLPWDGRAGVRLEVRLGECRLPAGAALLLEPFPVDDEYADRTRRD
jgi:alpha-amylase/alpha-mannosidase (GH57 family)